MMSLLSGRGKKKNPYCLARAGRKKKEAPHPHPSLELSVRHPSARQSRACQEHVISSLLTTWDCSYLFQSQTEGFEGRGMSFFSLAMLWNCARGEGRGGMGDLQELREGPRRHSAPLPSRQWLVTLAPGTTGLPNLQSQHMPPCSARGWGFC